MCLVEANGHGSLTGKMGEGNMITRGGYAVHCGQGQNILEGGGGSRVLIAKGARVCALFAEETST